MDREKLSLRPVQSLQKGEEPDMSATIINLIIQLVAGAFGGNAVGGLLKNIDLSPLAKTISGAVGGGLGGTILQSLIPALGGAASTGGFDIGAALGNAVGGGVTGAIVTVVVNLIKNAVFKRA
jgi:hypothetical protein